MKRIMAVLFLLAVAVSTVLSYAESAKGPYYNHGAYRGMPYRMTRTSTGTNQRSTQRDTGFEQKLGVVASKP